MRSALAAVFLLAVCVLVFAKDEYVVVQIQCPATYASILSCKADHISTMTCKVKP